MRVGFFFWPYTPEYTARMARLGEELGFDLVGIADTPGNALAPWGALTLPAAPTPRARPPGARPAGPPWPRAIRRSPPPPPPPLTRPRAGGPSWASAPGTVASPTWAARPPAQPSCTRASRSSRPRSPARPPP